MSFLTRSRDWKSLLILRKASYHRYCYQGIDCREGRVEWRHEGALRDKKGRFHLAQSTYSCLSDIPCPLLHPFSIESQEVLFPPPLPLYKMLAVTGSQVLYLQSRKVEQQWWRRQRKKWIRVLFLLCKVFCSVCLSVCFSNYRDFSSLLELNWSEFLWGSYSNSERMWCRLKRL